MTIYKNRKTEGQKKPTKVNTKIVKFVNVDFSTAGSMRFCFGISYNLTFSL